MDRTIRIAAAIVAAALVLTAATPDSVVAAPRATMSLSPDSGPPTSAFGARFSRLPANSSIVIHWDEVEIGRGSADSRGALILILNVPKTATPGVHVVGAEFAEGGDVSRKPFTVQTDWLQFHADATRAGANAFENVLSPGNVNGIIVYDRQATGGAIVGSAVACDGQVVVGSTDGGLHGFVPGAFTDPWLFQTRGSVVGTPVAIPPGPCLVAVGSSDGTLYAVHQTSGKLKWKANGSSPITSPALLYTFDPQPDPPGRILVGDESGSVRVYDVRGRLLWSTQLDGAVVGAAAWGAVPVDPMINQLDPGSRLFVATSVGNVYGLDPSTGTVLIAIRLGVPVVAAPAVLRLQGPPIPDIPVVVIGDERGVLHGLFGDDLSEAWAFQTGGPITTTPAIGDPNVIGDPHLVGDPHIFVASGDGTVYDLVTGSGGVSPAWATNMGPGVKSSPALANGVLYLCADDSRLRALDAESGRILFTSEEITCTNSSPIVVDGKVIVGTSHGELISFYLPL